MKKAAVVCAQGLGDGLLMMIVAHQLKQANYQLTIFHDQAKLLSSFFEGVTFLPHPPLKQLPIIFKSFDRVVIENDHSKRSYFLSDLRKNHSFSHIIFFFPTPSHLFKKGDFTFNSKLPIATNLREGCKKALHLKHATKHNGILFPQGKTYRKFPKRIVIHPTSNDPKRNWKPSQFLHLAHLLTNEGYTLSFSLSPSEHPHWLYVKQQGFELPTFTTLTTLGAYLYESGFLIGNDSGIGHLASNLGIPTLTISGNRKRVQLWRPDWQIGEIITPPFPLPNFKGIGLSIRENFWQNFISVQRTLKAFHQLKKLAK